MRFSGILLATSFLAGCFTEVGNAEDEHVVEAKFRVDPTRPLAAAPKRAALQTVSILRFYLGVREAEFHLFDSSTNQRAEYHLWKDDSALLTVDVTGKDPSATLPAQKVGGFEPENFKLECVLPSAKTLRPDTLDFSRFLDPGFIKGMLWDGRDSTALLFALPAGNELDLVYPKSFLEGWERNGKYECEFVFYANDWIMAVDLSGAAAVLDANGRKLILLDASHNPTAYAALAAAFPKSFNAPMASLQPGTEPSRR
jgi:hypothetical protein